MRISVKYSVSQWPHLVDINLEDIKAMQESGELTVTKDTPKGEKTISIEGTPEEMSKLSQLLQSHVD